MVTRLSTGLTPQTLGLSSENVDLASTKTYKINNVDVLSSTTLGAGVTQSSLTSVGTLESLTVSGVINSTTDVRINGTGVLQSASDEAIALAIALGNIWQTHSKVIQSFCKHLNGRCLYRCRWYNISSYWFDCDQ